MKTGDTLIDREDRTWVLDQHLGRGSWGSSWIVRDEHDRELVLKVAHGPDDFPADTAVPDGVLRACAEAVYAQARLLTEAKYPFLPRLEARIELADGRPALLMPRYSSSLERRIEGGLPLTAAVRILTRVARALGTAGVAHCALRPSNILLNDRGEPVLADMLTPNLFRWCDDLARLAPSRPRFKPPELSAPGAGWDTWAICQILYQVATLADGPGIRCAQPPSEGLDKVAVAALKDNALARLAHERTNQRFRGRLVTQLGSLLNRGLALQPEPSPPYRFLAHEPLVERLVELEALVAPRVEEVGRVLLSSKAAASVFEGGDEVGFSVTVACSVGVSDHTDVVCGLQLHDLDATGPDARVPVGDASFKVSKHPSGRLRFQFTLPGVPPGRYQVRTAFSIKDSGARPEVATGDFEVRPPAGYVPPSRNHEPETRGDALHFPTPDIAPPRIPTDCDELYDTGSDPGSDLDDHDLEIDHDVREIDLGRLRRPAPVATHHERAFDPASDATSDPGLSAAGATSPTASGGGEVIEGWFPRPIAPPVARPVESELETETTWAAAGGGRASQQVTAPPIAMPRPTAPTTPTTPGGPAAWAGGPGITGVGGQVPRAQAPRAPAMGGPVPAPVARVGGPPTGGGPALHMPRPSVGTGVTGITGRPAPQTVPGPRLADLAPPPSGPVLWTDPGIGGGVNTDPGLDGYDGFFEGGWSGLPGGLGDLGLDIDGLGTDAGVQSWQQRARQLDPYALPGVAWVVELVQRDSYTAFVAAVASSFVLLLLCMALLRTC